MTKLNRLKTSPRFLCGIAAALLAASFFIQPLMRIFGIPDIWQWLGVPSQGIAGYYAGILYAKSMWAAIPPHTGKHILQDKNGYQVRSADGHMICTLPADTVFPITKEANET